MDSGTAFDPDAATIPPFVTAATRSTASDELHRAVRAHRSRILGETIGAAIGTAAQFVAAWVRRTQSRYARWREARRVVDALSSLDNRTLRDLGFDRMEITSVAAELTGEAEPTRVRSFRSSRNNDPRPGTPSAQGAATRAPQARRDETPPRPHCMPQPRFALGITAVLLAAASLGMLVIVPASMILH